MNKTNMIDRVAVEVTKELIDKGKLVEAGFAALRHLTIPKNVSPVQIDEMRFAFMAGAEHLFSSIMVSLDPGDEPTEADMKRIELIGREIDEWRGRLSERVQPAQGRA